MSKRIMGWSQWPEKRSRRSSADLPFALTDRSGSLWGSWVGAGVKGTPVFPGWFEASWEKVGGMEFEVKRSNSTLTSLLTMWQRIDCFTSEIQSLLVQNRIITCLYFRGELCGLNNIEHVKSLHTLWSYHSRTVSINTSLGSFPGPQGALHGADLFPVCWVSSLSQEK